MRASSLLLGLLLCGCPEPEAPPPTPEPDDDDAAPDDDDSAAADDDDTQPDDDDSAPPDDDDDDDDVTPGDCETGVVHHMGNVTITSDDEAEGFCDSFNAIAGNLSVSGVSTLEPLACLCSVQGGVTIAQSPDLPHVDGLSQLEQLAWLSIVDNAGLTSIAGLASLAFVMGNLEIHSNPLLVSLSGLDGLQSVSGFFLLYGNRSLTDLDGLGSLSSVGWYLAIEQDDGLLSLDGATALRSVGGNLHISDDDLLTSLSGLHGIEQLGGDLIVTGNAALTVSEADALRDAIGVANIGGAIVLEDNGGGP